MDGTSQTPEQEKLNALRQLLPEVFSEGKIDWEKLKATLGDTINFANERYVLNWAGKSDAFKVLQSPTTKTLAPAKDESVNFDETDNIFIEGENLEVLKVLQKSYFGKVKMIYIDPPYNTGNDSFIYPDKFSESKADYEKRVGDKDEDGYMTKDGMFKKNSKENGQYHSNWLNMMMPRLYLAKNLLRQDGVIFVSIDDNEVHNLRLLMNEIFGEENFVSQIVWKGKGGGADNKYLMESVEYILMFSKNKELFIIGEEKKENEVFPKFDEQKNRKYKTQLARKWGANSKRSDRPNLFYSIISPEGTEVFPMLSENEEGCWRWGKDRMNEEISKNNIEFLKTHEGWIVYEKIYEPLEGEFNTKKYSNLIDNIANTAQGTKEVKELFENKVFDFPKPTILIKRLIEIAINNPNDIILDFFAGSGTTAHAVMALNKQDGGKRKYICVQLPELCDENSEAYKAGYKTIADISKERIRRAGKKIEAEIEEEKKKKAGQIDFDNQDNPKNDDSDIDLGFKVFKLEDSNFKQWQQIEGKDAKALAEQMKLFVDPVAENATVENIVFELLLKSGKDLNSRIEKTDSIYKINGAELILLLEIATQEIIETVIAEQPMKVIALDKLFKNNDQLKTNTVLQMRDAGIEFRTI